MTAPLVFYPLATLVDQIAALCAQRQSGNLVLISDDNRMAQMHLLQGLIMFIMCRGRRGQDALPLMRTMSHARMSLDSSAVVRNEGVAFSTSSVLAYLKGDTEQLPEPGSVTSAAQAPQSVPRTPQPAPQVRSAEVPAPAPTPAPTPAPAPTKGVSPDVKYLLQAAMVRYIGPMAEIVCEEHFARAQDFASLVAALAAEIPGKDQGAFKAEVAKSLGIAGS